MTNEYQLDELLLRYLSDETTPEEERKVVAWVNASAENQLYFQKLQNACDIVSLKQKMNQIDTERAWARFSQLLAKERAVEVKTGDDDQTYPESESGSRRAGIYKLLLATAAAASLVFFFILMDQPANPKNTGPLTAQQNRKQVQSTMPERQEINNSGNVHEMILKDGSKVLLFDKSELTFREPFAGDKRELVIQGKAEFKVAKDPLKPFVVYSNDLSTTALGTQFSVSNFKGSRKITIQLFEGKVVVKSRTNAAKKLGKPYYLVAGQELIYDQSTGVVKVKDFTTHSIMPVKTKTNRNRLSKENPSIPKNKKGSWYMFNNQSLADVFERLEAMYGVDIQFSKQDVQNLYFIGTFDRSDSVDKIIKAISDLNNLKVRKESNRYIIQK